MTTANTLDDFPADAFMIVVFCEGCDRETRLDRSTVPAGLAVEDLTSRLRCTRCGASNSSIRIVYSGAGGFHYGVPNTK